MAFETGIISGGNSQVKVSATDTTAGYLLSKLLAGGNITITQNNAGGNETLTIADGSTKITTKTADYTVTTSDSGIILMNSTSQHTFTLPTIASGDVGFIITLGKINTGKLILQAQTGAKIADSSTTGTAYNDLTNETYATIILQATTTTQWLILGGDGTWITT